MAEKITAVELAKQQREISVSEFFTKNRHLLGFDNPRKALLMAVKEAVDNALDVTLESKILPDVYIELNQIKEDRFRVIVEDNGPGIVKDQIPKIFGKLLYGSKFHRLRQSMGQQGIGISAVLLYGQLTTGKGMQITSKISSKKPANFYEIQIDTQKNQPIIIDEKIVEWDKDNGTRVEIEIEGIYQKGRQSVDEYVKEIALINPHAQITYKMPDGEKIEYKRAVNELPKESKEIKPHPYGVELGILIRMLQSTNANTTAGFLQSEFSRISQNIAYEICEKAKINPKSKPNNLSGEEAESLYKSIQDTKIIAPPTDCLSPLGEEALLKGIKKEIDAEFYCAVSRSPSVYRGMPFAIEVAIAFGGNLEKDGQVRVMRFANRVPLLYQQGACSTTESIIETAWRNYGLSQSKDSLPIGPAAIIVHMVSVWVPFTSEAKEAIAHYPEIIKDMKLALQDCGRKLSSYIRKTFKAKEQKEKIDLFEKYIPELAASLGDLSEEKKMIIEENLRKILKKGLKDLLNGIEEAEELEG
ncbi:DNA topoisomerase VI subunit B [Candidatus Woesearchaeota archaeon]|nr:DNA topoisomerase VI subunit B [Candidatus Woesearchaeota archaeon]